MIKIIKYFLEALTIYIFFFISKVIGLLLSRKFSSYIFKFLGPLIKSNKIINKNLLKFPKKLSDQNKKDIADSVWANYGMTFVEYIFLNKFRRENSHIDIRGEDILKKIIKNDKPVIFISGHFANFEFMSMEITKKKIKLATIYRPLNNIFLNPFMEYLRKKYICCNQIKKGRQGVREAMNFINKKYSIALMIDQRVSEGEKIKFFDQTAFTTTLPAQLALKYDLQIVPIFIERKFNNFFKMQVHEPIKASNFKNKFELTEKLNNELEKMIIKNPYQWIWTHDRWK
jgi:KDO2-lipid IV(A) lauroyltransferase